MLGNIFHFRMVPDPAPPLNAASRITVQHIAARIVNNFFAPADVPAPRKGERVGKPERRAPKVAPDSVREFKTKRAAPFFKTARAARAPHKKRRCARYFKLPNGVGSHMERAALRFAQALSWTRPNAERPATKATARPSPKHPRPSASSAVLHQRHQRHQRSKARARWGLVLSRSLTQGVAPNGNFWQTRLRAGGWLILGLRPAIQGPNEASRYSSRT